MKTIKVARLTICISFIIIMTLMLTNHSYAKIDKNSIVGIWLFEEAKGEVAIDSSGNGHDGQILGNIKRVNGKFGKGLEFPGSVDSHA
jgi:hypothetical protein